MLGTLKRAIHESCLRRSAERAREAMERSQWDSDRSGEDGKERVTFEGEGANAIGKDLLGTDASTRKVERYDMQIEKARQLERVRIATVRSYKEAKTLFKRFTW